MAENASWSVYPPTRLDAKRGGDCTGCAGAEPVAVAIWQAPAWVDRGAQDRGRDGTEGENRKFSAVSAPDHYEFVTWTDADGVRTFRCAGHVSVGQTLQKRNLARQIVAGRGVPDARVRIVNEAGGLLGSHPSIYKLAGRK